MGQTTASEVRPPSDVRSSRDERGLGARASALRRHNLSLILEHLHLNGPASRSELGALTALNRSTIADLVQELSLAGLVVEDGLSTPTGPGRPSPIVHSRPSGAIVIAVEIAVDSVAVATVGLGGHVFGQVRAELPRGQSSPEEIVQKVADLARPLLAALPAKHSLVGTGVAVVGITRRSDGFVQLAPNLGWRGISIGAMLAKALERPEASVRVANEADLGALGEHRRGAGRHVDNMVFVSGEVGIGAGLIIDGRPMLGADGYAGEAGHMLVNPHGAICRCGARGCWETEVGETALLARAGVSSEQSGLAAVNTLVRRLAAGDARAQTAAVESARWLGIGIGNLINLLNPELVVLGGLYHRLFEYIKEPLLVAVQERALEAATGMVQIVPSRLGPGAVLVGAAELYLAEVIADPYRYLPREATPA